jgi:hypothetical protein
MDMNNKDLEGSGCGLIEALFGICMEELRRTMSPEPDLYTAPPEPIFTFG